MLRHMHMHMPNHDRYIDDCIGTTASVRKELTQFITAVNYFHSALKYTWEIYDTSLNFLDIKISILDNGLCTTDSHICYLLYSSLHPSLHHRKEVHTFFTVQSDFVVYVVTTLILPENQRQSTSFSMNAANLFLSTTAPNKLIDSQHHKRLRRKILIAFLSHFTLRTKQLNLSFLNLSFRQ